MVVVGRSLVVVVDVGADRLVVVEPTLLLLLLLLCLATLTRYYDVIFMFLSFSVYISNETFHLCICFLDLGEVAIEHPSMWSSSLLCIKI